MQERRIEEHLDGVVPSTIPDRGMVLWDSWKRALSWNSLPLDVLVVSSCFLPGHPLRLRATSLSSDAFEGRSSKELLHAHSWMPSWGILSGTVILGNLYRPRQKASRSRG